MEPARVEGGRQSCLNMHLFPTIGRTLEENKYILICVLRISSQSNYQTSRTTSTDELGINAIWFWSTHSIQFIFQLTSLALLASIGVSPTW